MNLNGKKINFLGDSITYGVGTSSPEKRFTRLIAAEEHLAEMRNYGISGTRIAPQHSVSSNREWDKDFISRVAEMDADADIVVVFGGTNDFGHGDAPFGSFTDRTADTFSGACHVLMRTLREKYADGTVVILTPIHRRNEDGMSRCGHPFIDYVNAIRQTAEYYALPVLDLYAESGLQPALKTIRENYVPDGLHPNDAGHALLTEKILAYLRAL